MDCIIKAYRRLVLWLAGCLLVVVLSFPVASRSEILETICREDGSHPVDISELVEEAEATGMPPSTLNRLLVKGHASQAFADQLRRLLCIVVQAEEDGLSPDPLFEKLDEGLGKHVSLPQIVQVIEHNVDEMRFAQSILSAGKEPELEDEKVTRIAKAMAAGLPRDKLRHLFTSYDDVPIEMRVVAVEISAFAAVIGYDAVLLDRIITMGLTARSFTDDWAFFVKVISRARKKGISDERVAEKALEALEKKRSLNDLISSLGIQSRRSE